MVYFYERHLKPFIFVVNLKAKQLVYGSLNFPRKVNIVFLKIVSCFYLERFSNFNKNNIEKPKNRTKPLKKIAEFPLTKVFDSNTLKKKTSVKSVYKKYNICILI